MAVKLSERSLNALTNIVCGDGLPPGVEALYRSGPNLVKLFNEFGENDHYANGFPSRNTFALMKLRRHNDTPQMSGIIENVLDPLAFRDAGKSLTRVLDYLAPYLRRDGVELKVSNERVRVVPLGNFDASLVLPTDPEDAYLTEIADLHEKGERRVAEGDFKGAVTVARTLVEAALLRAQKLLTTDPPKYNGDLPQLYKQVAGLLNLDANNHTLPHELKTILRGLSAIVAGLAPFRNSSSDAHASTRRVARHHAALALNSSRTLVAFVNDTMAYQQERGSLTTVKP